MGICGHLFLAQTWYLTRKGYRYTLCWCRSPVAARYGYAAFYFVAEGPRRFNAPTSTLGVHISTVPTVLESHDMLVGV